MTFFQCVDCKYVPQGDQSGVTKCPKCGSKNIRHITREEHMQLSFASAMIPDDDEEETE